MKAAPPLLWFATIQCIEGKQNLTGLAPQGCFISAEAIERVAGQVGETQKTTRKVSGGFDGKFPRFRTRVGKKFWRCVESGEPPRLFGATDLGKPLAGAPSTNYALRNA